MTTDYAHLIFPKPPVVEKNVLVILAYPNSFRLDQGRLDLSFQAGDLGMFPPGNQLPVGSRDTNSSA